MGRPPMLRAVTVWIAGLFAVGSACFAVGAAPSYVDAVGAGPDAVTFFVGSLFFTAAATLQWLAGRGDPGRRRLDAWAALVQLAGTVFFNVSTFAAMDDQLTASEIDRRVWTPDARGSLCFLVSSGLAWLAVNHRLWRWRPRSREWLIAALNLVGSVAFGLSAVASYVVTDTAQVRNAALMNIGTFVGALAFLAGALLLLPARRGRAAPA